MKIRKFGRGPKFFKHFKFVYQRVVEESLMVPVVFFGILGVVKYVMEVFIWKYRKFQSPEKYNPGGIFEINTAFFYKTVILRRY